MEKITNPMPHDCGMIPNLSLPEGDTMPAFLQDMFNQVANPRNCNFIPQMGLARIVPLDQEEFDHLERHDLLPSVQLGDQKLYRRQDAEPLLFAAYHRFPLVHPQLHRYLFGSNSRYLYSQPESHLMYEELFPVCSKMNTWGSRKNRQGSRLVELLAFFDRITGEFEKAMTDEDFEDGDPMYVPHPMIPYFAMWQRGQWHINTVADPAWPNGLYQ
jgi:hypothetical protein